MRATEKLEQAMAKEMGLELLSEGNTLGQEGTLGAFRIVGLVEQLDLHLPLLPCTGSADATIIRDYCRGRGPPSYYFPGNLLL